MAVKASAPKPGVTRRAAEKAKRTEIDKLLLVITVDGNRSVLSPALIGPADDRECLKATGRRLSDLMMSASGGLATLGLDGVCALWWAARHASGDAVTYEACEAEFPSLAAIGAGGLSIGFESDDDNREVSDPNG